MPWPQNKNVLIELDIIPQAYRFHIYISPFWGTHACCMNKGWRKNKGVSCSTDIFQRSRLLSACNNRNIALFEGEKKVSTLLFHLLATIFYHLFLISKYLIKKHQSFAIHNLNYLCPIFYFSLGIFYDPYLALHIRGKSGELMSGLLLNICFLSLNLHHVVIPQV